MKKGNEKDESIDIYCSLCDFSNVIKIIINGIPQGHRPSQPDVFFELFDYYIKTYIDVKTKKPDVFDISSVCKYVNGELRIKDKVRNFYLTAEDSSKLENDIKNNIFKKMTDYSLTVSEIYYLLEHDGSMSDTKRDYLEKFYISGSMEDEAKFLAEVLLYTFGRPFIKHDKNKSILIKSGHISPITKNDIFGVDLPKCNNFFAAEIKSWNSFIKFCLMKKKYFSAA